MTDANRNLQVDKEWMHFLGRGFEWWAGPLVQRIWSAEPFESQGTQLWRVHAESDLVVEINDRHRAELTAQTFNVGVALSAFVYDVAANSLRLSCSALVHAGNVEWVSRLFSLAVGLQVSEAHAKVQAGLAGIAGGEVAASSPPGKRTRTTLDDITQIAAMIARASSDAKQGYTRQTLEDTRSAIAASGNTVVAGECLVALLRFPADAPDAGVVKSWLELVETAAKQGKTDPANMTRALWHKSKGDMGALVKTRERAALLQIDIDIPHPQYGHGALIRLELPVFVPKDQSAALTAEMNAAEERYENEAQRFGAWAVGPSGTLTHVLFLPAAMKDGSRIPNLALSEIARSRWADWYLARRTTAR